MTCSFELPAGEQPTIDMMASTFTAPEMAPSKSKRTLLTPLRSSIFSTAAADEPVFDFDRDEPEPAAHWPLLEVLRTRRPVVVRDCSKLIEGYPIRVWDELPTAAFVMPVVSNAEGGLPDAIIVLGLSCRLAFDAEYQAFLVSYLSVLSLTFAERVRRGLWKVQVPANPPECASSWHPI